jgi:DNA-binding MarR family transcriptional regulator
VKAKSLAGLASRGADMEARILAALTARKDTGDSVRKIAARFGIDPSTVQRISRPFDASAAA